MLALVLRFHFAEATRLSRRQAEARPRVIYRDRPRRFSELTERTLRRFGWRPHRDCSAQVAAWRNLETPDGFRLSEAAITALREFDGLYVNQHGRGRDFAREPFHIDATACAGEGDQVHISPVLNGLTLFPLGAAACNLHLLLIDQNGQVYGIGDVLRLQGHSIDEALEHLVHGVDTPILDELL